MKKKAVTIILTVVFAASVVCNVFQAVQIHTIKENLSKSEASVASVQAAQESIQAEWKEAQATADSLAAENDGMSATIESYEAGAKDRYAALDCTSLKAGEDGSYTFRDEFLSVASTYDYFQGASSDEISAYCNSIAADKLAGNPGDVINSLFIELGSSGSTLRSELDAAASKQTTSSSSSSSTSKQSSSSSSSSKASSSTASSSSSASSSTANNTAPSDSGSSTPQSGTVTTGDGTVLQIGGDDLGYTPDPNADDGNHIQ